MKSEQISFVVYYDPTGRKITAEEMNEVNMKRDVFHGEWNYIIKPSRHK